MTSDSSGIAVAFPGQGVDKLETCGVLEAHEGAAIVSELAERVGTNAWRTLDFQDTSIQQPCIFVASYLNATANIRVDGVQAVIGHSLGQIAALVFAESLSLTDGLAFVSLRGELCRRAQEQSPGRMAAFMQLERDELEWIRRMALTSHGGVLEVAAVNGPGQVVLSGSAPTLEAAVTMAREGGALVVELAINAAMHTPLMARPIPELKEALVGVEVETPRVPFVSCVFARALEDPEDIRKSLVRDLVLPVRWMEALDALRDAGVTSAWDAGPGQTLRKLAKRGGSVRFVSELGSASRGGTDA
ncbi:MAG TPA: ACP S-malonyltransferase [Actinomycetota bacterium]|jgi:[acyl-carrier-protein] S-malonyltransferase|nr:ACP S-malonyltransferase [Actinomycetota bacterium]